MVSLALDILHGRDRITVAEKKNSHYLAR
jgi:hypothetical protein